VITKEFLLETLTNIKSYIYENKNYPTNIVEYINNYNFTDTIHADILRKPIDITYKHLVDTGDVDQFYTKMYSENMLVATNKKGLHRDAATLIIEKAYRFVG